MNFFNEEEEGFAAGRLRSLQEGKHNLVVTVEDKLYKERFLVKRGNRLYSITFDSIAYVFTRERHQFIRTHTNQDYIVDATLDELEQQLDPELFFRINRQYIVGYKAIEYMTLWFDGKLKMKMNPEAGEDLLVGRARVPDFKRWMGK